jgi:hypothetical protein
MLIGIVGIIDGLRLNRASAEAGDAYGPGWYLILLSLILLFCGLIYLVSSLKRQADKEAPAFAWLGPATFAIFAMILSCALLPYVGYFISTAAFLLVATRVFGESSWVKSVLLAGLAGVFFWFVFVYLAKIPMP